MPKKKTPKLVVKGWAVRVGYEWAIRPCFSRHCDTREEARDLMSVLRFRDSSSRVKYRVVRIEIREL